MNENEILKIGPSIARTVQDYRAAFNAVPEWIELAADIHDRICEGSTVSDLRIMGWEIRRNDALDPGTIRAAGRHRNERWTPPKPREGPFTLQEIATAMRQAAEIMRGEWGDDDVDAAELDAMADQLLRAE